MTALLRLEAAGVLRTRIVWASGAGALLLVAAFVAVSTREYMILAFTGFERILTGVGLAALMFVPLLALFATVLSFAAARQQGVLEWYLSHPISRDAVFVAMWAPRTIAVAGPVVLAVLGLGVVSLLFGEPVRFGTLTRLLGVFLGQVACFAAFGGWLSVTARSVEHALLRGILVWMASTLLLDFALIGAMLRWHLPPHVVFALSAINPVQAGRLGILAGSDPELGVLGPVGTWISLTLGPTGTVLYALLWPCALGGLAFLAARRAFRRRDLL